MVGTVALDTLANPCGRAAEVVGGSAVYFAYAASCFAPVRLASIIGSDFPEASLRDLESRGVDTAGLVRAEGKTFRWSGSYGKDLKEASTLSVELNVISDFEPDLPEHYRETPWVFLANIDPRVQLSVLRQTSGPRTVVCDTMNFWIENRREDLLRLLKEVDILILNDEEVRLLTGEQHLLLAGRKALKLGPGTVVVKKGEHGALLYTADGCLCCVPAYPTTRILDPTGAGDSFGGGFTGYLAEKGELSEENLRRAVVCGMATASFTVESFGVEALRQATRDGIAERFTGIRRLVSF